MKVKTLIAESQTCLIGKVVRIADETTDTRRLWIEVPGPDKFDFLPGQFVTLHLPGDDNTDKIYRCYSIASSPDGTNVFELLIALYKNGLGTPYFFNKVKVGSKLIFEGPRGLFILSEPINENIFMICTGTGIAPFRSMIHHINNRSIPYRNIYLITGYRTQKAILYYDEMVMLQKVMQGFHFIPTLSREQWEGHTGYVHHVYESLCKDRKPARFFLAGCKGMIEDAKKKITQMGYDRIMVH